MLPDGVIFAASVGPGTPTLQLFASLQLVPSPPPVQLSVTGVTSIIRVAGVDATVPSLALKVSVSMPMKPVVGV